MLYVSRLALTTFQTLTSGCRSSAQALHATVKSQTAAVWAHTNILKLLESLQGEQASQNTPPLDADALIARYKAAGKRLLLFDYGRFFILCSVSPSNGLSRTQTAPSLPSSRTPARPSPPRASSSRSRSSPPTRRTLSTSSRVEMASFWRSTSVTSPTWACRLSTVASCARRERRTGSA
jgi:hypothetical protein